MEKLIDDFFTNYKKEIGDYIEYLLSITTPDN